MQVFFFSLFSPKSKVNVRAYWRGCRGQDRYVRTTDALNRQEPPRLQRALNIDDYHISRGSGGEWVVEGDAISRFAQMTNWNYYEAALRFQKVLDAAGACPALP